MNNLKISTRLAILTGMLCLLLAAIGALGLWGTQRSNESLKTVYEDRTVPLAQLGDVQHHARQRLAAGAAGFGLVRAEKHRVDAPAGLMRQMVHFFVHGVQRVHIEQAPAQAGLIGGHGHGPAGFAQVGDGRDGAGQGNPLVDRFDVVVGVVINHAVAVEDQ